MPYEHRGCAGAPGGGEGSARHTRRVPSGGSAGTGRTGNALVLKSGVFSCFFRSCGYLQKSGPVIRWFCRSPFLRFLHFMLCPAETSLPPFSVITDHGPFCRNVALPRCPRSPVTSAESSTCRNQLPPISCCFSRVLLLQKAVAEFFGCYSTFCVSS